MRRWICVWLCCGLCSVSLTPALAQYTEPIPTSEEARLAECAERGKQDASKQPAGGQFAAGFASGVILGLVGAAIVTFTQSPSEPNAIDLLSVDGDACRWSYLEAYKKKSKSRKQAVALTGGLMGTAVIVAVLLSATN